MLSGSAAPYRAQEGPVSPCSPGRARPNAVLAAVAAARPGSVKATVLTDACDAAQAFAEADAKNTMGSAWKFTADYAQFLGCKGVVCEVHAGGAVQIAFEPGVSLWFPAGAVAQFTLPPSTPSLERVGVAVNQSPAVSLAATLMDMVRHYPQLGTMVLQRLTAHNRGYSSPGVSSVGSPSVASPAEDDKSSLAQRVSWSRMLTEVEPVPHVPRASAPPFCPSGYGASLPSNSSQSQLSTPASMPEPPPYSEPVTSPKMRQSVLEEEDLRHADASVSIVSQMLDDIFDDPQLPSS